MINRAVIEERVREWGLREDVVEKDYLLGWLLWGIGADEALATHWVFKGGTCLKKCYLETYRFSADLDFTVMPATSRVTQTVLPASRAPSRGAAPAKGELLPTSSCRKPARPIH